MKRLWEKTSDLTRFYFFSFLGFIIAWGALSLLSKDFVNQVFFMTAYVWHFALLAPGLKEKVMARKQKYSFLAIITRANHYLQLFITLKNIPFASAIVRSLSPLAFTLMLLIFGGGGNLLFCLLGSACFEVVYYLLKRFLNRPIFLGHTGAPEIPPEIPSEKKNS